MSTTYKHNDRIKYLEDAPDLKVHHDDYDVRNWPIYTHDGHKVGVIENLIIDNEGMRVRYLDVHLTDLIGSNVGDKIENSVAKATDKIDTALDKTGDAIERGVHKTGAAIDRAGDAIERGVHKAGDAIDGDRRTTTTGNAYVFETQDSVEPVRTDDTVHTDRADTIREDHVHGDRVHGEHASQTAATDHSGKVGTMDGVHHRIDDDGDRHMIVPVGMANIVADDHKVIIDSVNMDKILTAPRYEQSHWYNTRL